MDLDGKWKPILIGGLITGLAPFVPLLNLACCLYPILGAIVAVAVYRSSNPPSLSYNDGVALGALTGVAGTVIYAVLVVPITILLGGVIGGFLRAASPQFGDVPPHVRPLLDWVFGHFGAAVGIVVALKIISQLGLSLIFGILGGLIGVALLQGKKT